MTRGPVVPDRADICVAGAGTAGAAAAAMLARAGLSVVCLERGDIAGAGARWVNGVPATDFDDAGLPRPTGDELLSAGGPFHLVAGWGPARLVIDDHGVLEVDMRKLVDRLQRYAREAGAVFAGDAAVRSFEGGVVETTAGPIRAELVIDAAGLTGPGLLGQPRVAPEHLCAAAQEVRALRDAGAAREFFAAHRVPVGQVLCFTGIAGGYSIVNVRCAGDHVSILTGSIPATGQPSGRALLDDFVAGQPWIGDRLFGGSRAIPIRRPFDVLASDRVAAIGDAAAQVFPAHGSGIGAGMVAARYLADAVAGGGPREYAVRWQRERGGLFASYDLFRRFSQSVTASELVTMMEAGIMDAELARAGMAQVLPRPRPALLAGKIAPLLRHRSIARRMGAVLARMVAARALYRRYPRDPRRLPTWSKSIATVFGEVADPPASA